MSLIKRKKQTMDLKDFISETIEQIAQGVLGASQRCKDKNLDVIVNPNVTIGSGDGAAIPSNPHAEHITRRVQVIDMDIAVTVQTSKEKNVNGGIGISVLSIGGKRGSDRSDTHESRIHFSIPVSFPVTQVPTVVTKDKYSEIDY